MSFPQPGIRRSFSEIDVDVFLRQEPRGPVHQALVTVLATLDDSSGEYLRPAAIGELRAAPGQAVVRHWSSLSPETQHNVFEAAVRASGETLRPALARPA